MIHGWTTCIRSYIMHRALSSPMQCIVRYPHPCSASFDRCPHPGSASFDRCPHLHVAYHTSIVHHTSVAYRTSIAYHTSIVHHTSVACRTSIAYHTSIVYHTSIYTSASLDRWHHSCDASFFIRSVSAPTCGISFIDRIIHRSYHTSVAYDTSTAYHTSIACHTSIYASASFDRCPHPCSASFDRCPHLHVAYHSSIVSYIDCI